MTNDRTVLVDGNNLLHRAHHIYVTKKIESPIVSKSGYPAGLIYGVLYMLSDWMYSMSRPTKMVYFQDGTPTRRRALDPGYCRREPDGSPPMITPQPITLLDGFHAETELDVISHIMNLVGADVYHSPKEEADDLIASYIRKFLGIHIVISSDRDFYQLLSDDRVILYRPGIDGNRFFDAERAMEDMLKRFKVNLHPSGIKMFKALTGDSSDSIPGVPRLRKKIAAPLCQCRTVEELMATGLPGFSKSEKINTEGLQDRIRLNLELVQLIHDIDLEPLRTPSSLNFELASRILREDLSLNLNLSSFRIQPEIGKFRTADTDDFYSRFID